jgi:hypothetical protein
MRDPRSCAVLAALLIPPILLGAVAAVPAATLHVDPGAPAGGDGSAAAPRRSLAAALAAAAAGDTLVLAAGTYRETVPVTAYGQPRLALLPLVDGVVVLGAGPDRTVLEAPPADTLTFGISAEDVSRATVVAGLTVTGACFQGINLRGADPVLREVAVVNPPTGTSSVACDVRDGSDPLLVDCVLDGGHGALFVEFGSSGDYVRCRIGRRVNDGLVVHRAAPRLTDCVLEGAGRWTLNLTQDAQPVLTGCTIGRGDDATVRVQLYPPGSVVDLGGNRWFSDDPAVLAAAIIDADDDPALGAVVVFLPLLQGVATEPASLGRLKALYR